MTEHFTRSTVEASHWCAKCQKRTMHRVDADAQQGRLGPCLECIAKLDGKRADRRFCKCGREAVALCDWKVSLTKLCDEPVCQLHAKKVAPRKFLCPSHDHAWEDWKRRHPPAQQELFQEGAA